MADPAFVNRGPRLRLCNGRAAGYPAGMLRHARPRPSLLLRLLMLVAVGLGVFGTATASALADIHISLHADAAHGADDVAGEGPDADPDAGDLLHTLVHCGHCHGHGGVLPMASLPWVLPAAPAHAVPTSLAAQLRTQPPESLLRPPIAS
jgi:mono/diheme cytochrome c family protein